MLEVFNNGSIIKSVRLYCANITTGKTINVLDPSTNKIRKYASIVENFVNNYLGVTSKIQEIHRTFKTENENRTSTSTIEHRNQTSNSK